MWHRFDEAAPKAKFFLKKKKEKRKRKREFNELSSN